jgi:nitrous oxide reductase accessory protein NosL
MLGASILLGGVFLALGLIASTLVRQRSTAGGIAIGLWLLFVILYGMAFLGLLVASGSHSLQPLLIDTLLALNPTDVYRLLTLGAGGAGGLTGIGALAGQTALTPPRPRGRPRGLDGHPPGAGRPRLLPERGLMCALSFPNMRLAGSDLSSEVQPMIKSRTPPTLCAALAFLALAACKEEAVKPAPHTLTDAATGRYCGMMLAEHEGPKGQILLEGVDGPVWFSSARDTLAFTLLPEEPKDIAAMYVSNMGAAATWADPGTDNWTDAHAASFVVGSTAEGGMGGAEAVPFADPAMAATFAAEHGGEVVACDAIPAA